MRVPGIPFTQGRNGYSDPDGKKYGIAIHNTSNDASAANEASYATRRTDGTSAHFYADSSQVIQSLDTSDRAGHAGSTHGNNHAVAVEITGTNDKSRAWWLANVNWDQLGRALAAVCREYGIAVRRATVAEMRANPQVKAFYSHDDMRQAWGGTDHTDPGGNYPWDRLFQAVNTALNPPQPPQEVPDMEQSEKLAAKTLFPGTRSVADLYGDLSNLRDWLVMANPAKVPAQPDPGSLIVSLAAMAKAFPALVAKLDALGTSQAALAANLSALPGAVRAQVEQELGELGEANGLQIGQVIQNAVERAVTDLRITITDPA